MIQGAFQGRRKQLQVENPRWVMTSEVPKHRKGGVTAWISVMRGCNHSCTFCIVPRVRGREVSRTPEDILKEVEELSRAGYKEVILLGQNINSYGRDLRNGINFPKLLGILNQVEGLERIRFTTSHPVDIREDLIDAMSQLDKVCEALHFPIQAGSNEVLEAMKRGYTRERYLEKVRKAREKIPGVSISTDLIVGFPGETEKDFLETCRVMEEIQFDGAFIFKYSQRSGTPAAVMENQVLEKVKEERHQRLFQLQEEISLKKNQSFLGQCKEVLAEGEDRKIAGRLYGRSRDNRIVLFEGSEQYIGKVIQVRVEHATANALYGKALV
jgi:tRNA-2-methylthio-N6-dimethylallyladenosine synthase